MTTREIEQAKTLGSSLFFTRYHFKHRFNKKFVPNWHHEVISDHLDKVFSGEIKRLAIRIAPRYSKTELAVKNFIALGLALNPASKFIHLSYSQDLALDNSEEIRDFIQEESYTNLYPWVTLDKASTAKKKWYTTEGGGVYATATGGQITGFGAGEVEELQSEIDSIDSTTRFAGAIVIDDPLKPDDADSDVKRERINERFENTIRSRTNSRNTPIIIIGQAVHERDLIGYLMETEGEKWTLLSLPCIQQDEEGKDFALWPHKHSLEELYQIRRTSERTFDSQYQQDPKDLLGLLLPINKLMFAKMDAQPLANICFVDPADTGGDKLSAIFCRIYTVDNQLRVFVYDVIHNTDGIKAGSSRINDKINEHGVDEIFIESNGIGLALIIELKGMISQACKLSPITAKDAKEVRIMQGFEGVLNWFVFDEDYKENIEYSHYMKDLTSFKREGQNLHKKDAIDVTTTASNILKIRYKSIIYSK